MPSGATSGWTDGSLSLAGSLGYAASHISTERRIVFGGVDRTAEADYWSHTIFFSGEAAYGFDLANGTTISPLFTLEAGWSPRMLPDGAPAITPGAATNRRGRSRSRPRI